jgi:uncharacterized protein YndB with AHSA1/START domain
MPSNSKIAQSFTSDRKIRSWRASDLHPFWLPGRIKSIARFSSQTLWPSGSPPNGFACTVHKLEAQIGGSYRMSFRNFTTSQSHSFNGQYIELIPNQRLRYVDRFDGPNLTGGIQVTVTLRPVSVGTDLDIIQEGLPDMIPVETCYLGWQDSLQNLADLSSQTSIAERLS